MEFIVAVIVGSIIGVALYWMGASNKDKTQEMLRLENLTMLKTYLFATGLATILLGAACMIGIFDTSHFAIEGTDLSAVIGGLLAGLAFGWIGTEPYSCLSALGGDGFKSAIVTFLGGLVGAFLFSLTYGWWKEIGFFRMVHLNPLTIFKVKEEVESLFTLGYEGTMALGVFLMILALILPKRGVD